MKFVLALQSASPDRRAISPSTASEVACISNWSWAFC
ncbi:hypothetical protein ABMA10_04335 [Plantibacter sp. RU18]